MAFAEISYYYRKRFADFKMNILHAHSKYKHEIMYVSSGKCEIITPEQTITLTTGEYIIISNCQPHRLTAQKADILNIEFYIHNSGVSINDIEADFAQLLEMFSHRLSVYSDTGEVYTAIRQLIDELQNHGKGICSDILLKRMLIELCRNNKRSVIGGTSYINKAKKYIETHLCERITVPALALDIGINHSYLQTLFKQHTGKTIIDYINSLRIDKACFIMKNTNLSIVDIAIDCCFSSRQHFMYTFKKHTGKTAREYRKD